MSVSSELKDKSLFIKIMKTLRRSKIADVTSLHLLVCCPTGEEIIKVEGSRKGLLWHEEGCE